MIFGDSPPREKMVGVWTLADESIAIVERYTKTPVGKSTLTLKPDGTFDCVNLPVEGYSGIFQWSLKSTGGKWSLRKNRVWDLELDLSGFSFPISILKTPGGNYVLSFSVISPDSGEFWLWQKELPKN